MATGLGSRPYGESRAAGRRPWMGSTGSMGADHHRVDGLGFSHGVYRRSWD